MKNVAPIVFFVLSFCAASCKKADEKVLSTSMTVTVNRDTAFVTQKVTTDARTEGVIYINATSNDGLQHMDLALTGYTKSKKTFQVDYRGLGGNMTGNTGQYLNGSNAVMARAGRIIVTEVKRETFSGTFELYFDQTEIRGAFTAPAN